MSTASALGTWFCTWTSVKKWDCGSWSMIHKGRGRVIGKHAHKSRTVESESGIHSQADGLFYFRAEWCVRVHDSAIWLAYQKNLCSKTLTLAKSNFRERNQLFFYLICFLYSTQGRSQKRPCFLLHPFIHPLLCLCWTDASSRWSPLRRGCQLHTGL